MAALAALAALLAVGSPAPAGAHGRADAADGDKRQLGPLPFDEDLRTLVDLNRARAATAAYHVVPLAERDGYALPPAGVPLHECIAAFDGSGAMGFHFINATNVSDAILDPTRPEAVVYEPTAGGRLRLVALEYVIFADVWEAAHPGDTPRLFGQDLTFVPSPNRFGIPAFYEIHAWVWKANPAGTFADFNPEVSC